MGAGNSSAAGLERASGRTGLADLPESCVAGILLRLDPPEICRLARLCHTFRAAASSDVVWETKLPGNYKYLLGKALGEDNSDGQKLSKKEIFALLCRRNPFNGAYMVWVQNLLSFSSFDLIHPHLVVQRSQRLRETKKEGIFCC